MVSRTFSEQWESLRPRFNRFRSWLGTGERTHTLAVVLWPLVVLIIAILVIRHASTAKDVADLISAVASLTWPVVAVVIVNWFRPEFRAILSRIRRGKFLGTEFELDELQAKTEAAEATRIVSATGSAAGTSSVSAQGARMEGAGIISAEAVLDEIEEVLHEASRSPRLGLMLLSAKIERAARELASGTGLDVIRGTHPSLIAVVRALLRAGRLTIEDGDALLLFSQVRNRIVHGHDADDEEVARAIDSGTRLLRLLLARPRPEEETKRPEDGG
jgi:hypothetical protein